MKKNKYFIALVVMMGSYLYAEDNFNTPENLKERENKANAFVRQELEKGTSADEIQNAIKKEFFPLIPGTDEYKKLAADAERVRQDGYRCSDAREVIEKFKLASDIRKKAPEYQVFKKLGLYILNQNHIKNLTDQLLAKQKEVQQNIGIIEEQNKTLLALFTLSQKTTNEREQSVNLFVCQKLAAKISVKAIEQELEEKFCKHIPEHHTIGLLDSDKLRLGYALEVCRKERQRHHLMSCNALEKEYEAKKRQRREARRARENTPELMASKKLHEYHSNDEKIEKLRQQLQQDTEKIEKDIESYEHDNKTMFGEVV